MYRRRSGLNKIHLLRVVILSKNIKKLLCTTFSIICCNTSCI
jgi:hypothetical protein